MRIGYHSRSSDEFSERVIEPYLLRRDQRGWYVEAYDHSKDGRRTFKVEYVRSAELLPETYEPRSEMSDLDSHLGGEIGTAKVLFSPKRARYEREGRPECRCWPTVPPWRRSATARCAGWCPRS